MEIKELMKTIPSSKAISIAAFILLGGILVFSGIGKIVDSPDMENVWITGVLGQSLTNIAVHVLPYIELLIGALLIARLKIKWLAWATMVLVLNFIINNTWLIQQGKGFESCGQCLGWGIDTWPVGSLYIDLMMLGLLLVGTKAYQSNMKEVANV